MRKTHLIALLYGWITILFFILLSSAIIAFIIRFTYITEFTLSYLTLAIGLLTLFIGGFITGIKGKEMGLILGLITGVGFSLLTFLIQFLGFNELFSIQQTIYQFTYILSAVVGGVVGVNIINSNQQSNS